VSLRRKITRSRRSVHIARWPVQCH
jgi:hypothetical protein